MLKQSDIRGIHAGVLNRYGFNVDFVDRENYL